MPTQATASDKDRYLATYADAAERARYSDFDIHIVRSANGSYWCADEGDYGCDMAGFANDIVHTVAGRMSGHY